MKARTMRRRWERFVLGAVAGVVASVPSLAHAWKPVTHVYLAQQAWDDANDDGKVTIYRVDTATGQIKRVNGVAVEVGRYNVKPELRAAIRANPHKFFAGVLGPDAYPDIATGQMRIHPPGIPPMPGLLNAADSNPNGPGTDPWLQQMWAAAWTNDRTDAHLAWVTGFLAHAAGDVYAHTFMNTFAGGIFDLQDRAGFNQVKHITIEGYVAERTPPLHDIDVPATTLLGGAPGHAGLDIYQVVGDHGIEGIEPFIIANVTDVPGFPGETNTKYSVPHLLKQLKTSTEAFLATYDQEASHLQSEWANASWLASPFGAAAEMSWACGTSPTRPCPDSHYTTATCPQDRFPTGAGMCFALSAGGIGIWASIQATYASIMFTLWRTYVDTQRPIIDTSRNRVASMQQALTDWVRGSHRVGTSIFFTEAGVLDSAGVTGGYGAFKNDAVLIATGLPPQLGPLLSFVQMPAEWVSSAFDHIKHDLEDWLLKAAIGMTMAELKLIVEKPHVYFNRTFQANQAPNLAPINMVSANGVMGVTSSGTCGADLDGACDIVSGLASGNHASVARFNVDPTKTQPVFPAAHNTVTMIKLLLMDPTEVVRLMSDLGAPGATMAPPTSSDPRVPPNAMLGFVATIDGSHQWAASLRGGMFTGQPMVVAKSCPAYVQAFLDQRPFLAGTRWSPKTYAPTPSNASPAMVIAPLWEPPASAGCYTTLSGPTTLPQKQPLQKPIAFTVRELTPSTRTIPRGSSTTFEASAPATFTASYGSVHAQTDGKHVDYTAPIGFIDGSDTVVATFPDGQTARATVLLSAPLAIHVDRVPPRTTAPQGDGLHGGESTRLYAQPAGVPVSWSIVRGSGRLGDPAAEAALLATLSGHDTHLATISRRYATQMGAATAAPCRATKACREKGVGDLRRVVGEAETYVRANSKAIGDANAKLAALRSTYFAPATIAKDEIVVVRATAKDGRTTDVEIRLLAPPPAIVITNAPREVKSGDAVTLAVDPPVPMTWTLVSGPGTMGDPGSKERATLVSTQITPFVSGIDTQNQKLVNARRTDRPALHRERTAAIVAGLEKAGAAFKRVAEIDATYHAPPKGRGEQIATVRGTANDGSGRTVTIALRVVP